jgi:hypothetical protein
VPGQRERPGQGGGDGTGRNPTDRGKPGVKLHLLTDAAGIPLAARVGPANRHDSTAFEAMLDAVPPIRTPAGRRRKRPVEASAVHGVPPGGVAGRDREGRAPDRRSPPRAPLHGRYQESSGGGTVAPSGGNGVRVEKP